MQPSIAGRMASRALFRKHLSPGASRTTPSNYICNDCLRKSRGIRFLQHKSAAPAAIQTQNSFSHAVPPLSFDSSAKHDDRLLRDIFDSPRAYQDFNAASSHRSAGLFQNRYLTSPHGFERFAETSLKKARRVVDRVSNAKSTEELIRVIKDLDRLSDLLCRVLDLSDFVRNTHPDVNIVQAADSAYNMMFEYMNVLNTTTALYDTLKRAMNDPEVVKRFGEEEYKVARTLLADFEKSGINLPASSKRKFIDLSNDIARIGHQFVSTATAAASYLALDATKLKGMDPWTVSRLSKMTNSGKVYVPSRGPIAAHALQSIEDPEIRRQVYMSNQTASKAQVDLLEAMLKTRGQLAVLVGRESYADVTLAEKMARSPGEVTTFLESMLAHTKPRALEELKTLSELQRKHTRRETNLNAWDTDFYIQRLMDNKRRTLGVTDVSPYFSLGTVMQGLSRLFSQLFGVRLVPRETLPGETWNSDVRRLDVISESEGHIAVVYCDLFQREGKSPNPAHFTLRCGRAIEEEEIEEELLNEGGSDGMAAARNKDGMMYQMPTIALICDFETSPGNSTSLLSFSEVSTLFHEMGHAIHSILGRTKYHEVAGTRCSTDFAEFPSILMEHFARSPEVLAMYARHYKTDEPLPQKLMDQRLGFSSLFENCEMYQQVILSLLDQGLHSKAALEKNFNSSAIAFGVEKRHGLLPAVEDISGQGYFTHLFGYGGLYYSYQLDKAIADKVWKEVFRKNPLSREAGEKYKEEVLRWGGSRDPWKCIGRLLGREDLEDENGVRMREVGKWALEVKEK